MHATIAMHEGILRVLDRSIDLLADTLKVALVSSTYAENKDDQFIDTGGASDVVDARIAGTTDQTLGSKAVGRDTTGDFAYFDGADVTFVAVASGTVAKAVLYKDTGTPTTSRILGVFDITDIVANGGDITISFAAPASGGVLKYASA